MTTDTRRDAMVRHARSHALDALAQRVFAGLFWEWEPGQSLGGDNLYEALSWHDRSPLEVFVEGFVDAGDAAGALGGVAVWGCDDDVIVMGFGWRQGVVPGTGLPIDLRDYAATFCGVSELVEHLMYLVRSVADAAAATGAGGDEVAT